MFRSLDLLRDRSSVSEFDLLLFRTALWTQMDVERTITEIEWLERISSLPDSRALTASDVAAANRRHDEALANSPWFRLWQTYGLCCRSESPIIRLPE